MATDAGRLGVARRLLAASQSTVAFTGAELWGTDADPRSIVSFDAFEPYLEPV